MFEIYIILRYFTIKCIWKCICYFNTFKSKTMKMYTKRQMYNKLQKSVKCNKNIDLKILKKYARYYIWKYYFIYKGA